MGGRFRVEVDADAASPAGPRYKAVLSAIEDVDAQGGSRVHRPLVFPDGARAVFYGGGEPDAYNAAVAFLTSRFGGFSTTPIDCGAPDRETTAGPPYVLDLSAGAGPVT